MLLALAPSTLLSCRKLTIIATALPDSSQRRSIASAECRCVSHRHVHAHEPHVTGPACMQEFCNGGSLREALMLGVFGGGPRALRRRWGPITAMLRGVAKGLAYVHAQSIVHGDVNPANILLQARPVPLPPVSLSLSVLGARYHGAALSWPLISPRSRRFAKEE